MTDTRTIARPVIVVFMDEEGYLEIAVYDPDAHARVFFADKEAQRPEFVIRNMNWEDMEAKMKEYYDGKFGPFSNLVLKQGVAPVEGDLPINVIRGRFQVLKGGKNE
jgi:hypothetical protein